ncbi:MAG: regulatory protein RecX [Betaproteobacteria bacterium]
MNRAYLDALKMLGRRELSERQLRERLARKEHAPEDVDAAVDRLRAERALDDNRVAEAIARTEATVRRRGRLRAVRQIESAGIDRDTARRAADGIFESVDASALLEAALAKRLRGREAIADDREFQRLYRYLVGQGFESDQVVRALKSRRSRG